MKSAPLIVLVLALSSAMSFAQDSKPVPKDSVRVEVPGCSKGYVFTAASRTESQPGSGDVPAGMHLRMNGPKAMMAQIKAREGSMLVLTGLMKKGQYGPSGIGIGGGVRIGPGPGPGGGIGASAVADQAFIDVEGWRPGVGECPSR